MSVNLHGLPQPFVSADFTSSCIRKTPEGFGRSRQGSGRANLLNELNCFVACEQSTITFTANNPPDNTLSTFSWQVAGDYVNYTANDNEIEVTFGDIGSATLIVEVINENGCKKTVSYCIDIVEKPEIALSINHPDADGQNIEICSGQSLLFESENLSEEMSLEYAWFVNGEWVNNTPMNLNHTFDEPGNYEVMLVVNNECNCTDTAIVNVEVGTEVIASIDCEGLACFGDTVSYTIGANCTPFQWSVVGGSIVTENGNTLEVVWDAVGGNGYGQIIIDGSTCEGICPNTAVYNIPVMPPVADIEGNQTICSNGGTQTYHAPFFPGSSYQWTLTENTQQGNSPYIIGYSDQPSLMVEIPEGFLGDFTLKVGYDNQLIECEGEGIIEVDVKNEMSWQGPTHICAYEEEMWRVVPTHTSGFTWELDGVVQSETSHQFTEMFTQAGTYTLHVSHPDYCNELEIVVVVSDVPPPPPTLNGPDTICPGLYYTYTGAPTNSDYFLEWNVKDQAGNSIFNNEGSQIELSFPDIASAPYTVELRQVNLNNDECKSAPLIQEVYVSNPPEIEIIGNDTVCANAVNTYEVEGADTDDYFWTMTPNEMGSILENNSASVAIQWNNVTNVPTSVTLSASTDYCGTSIQAEKTVVINNAPPPIIEMTGDLCEGNTLNFTVSNVQTGNFEWQFPAAASNIIGENTNQASAIFNESGNYTVGLEISNPNGCLGDTVQSAITFYLEPQPVAQISLDSGVLNYYLCEYDSAVDDLYARFVRTSQDNPNYTYVWQINNVNIAGRENQSLFEVTANNIGIPLDVPGTADIRLEVTDTTTGCSNVSNLIKIRIHECDSPCIAQPMDIMTTIEVDCGVVSFEGSVSPIENQIGALYWDVNYPSGFQFEYQYYTNDPFTHSYSTSGLYQIFTRAYTLGYDLENDTINPMDTCAIDTLQTIAVPLVPNFEVAFECDMSNEMQVDWIRTTDYIAHYTTFENTIWTIAQNGTPIYSGSSPPSTLAGGTYTVTLIEVYSFTHPVDTIVNDTCSITKTIDIPEPATAAFSYAPNPVCVGQAVHFTDESIGDVIAWHWDYGDGTSSLLQHSFRTYDGSVPDLEVTFTITDIFGCQHSTESSLTVHPADLRIDIEGDSIACANIGSVLEVIIEDGIPNNYLWNTSATTPSITVTATGTYEVEVWDVNGCSQKANQHVFIPDLPAAYIIGPEYACVHQDFTLSGPSSNFLEYEWQYLNNGSWISVGGNHVNFTNDHNQAGIHKYRLIVKNNAGYTTFSCLDTSSVYQIEIIDLPEQLDLQIDYDCTLPGTAFIDNINNYQNPIINWSTGDYQVEEIPLYFGGIYQASITDMYGCKTQYAKQFSHLPATDHIPMGCASPCDTSLPVTLYTQLGYVDNWEWFRDYGMGMSTTGQSGSGFPFLNINNPTDVGTWYLTIEGNYNNTTCTDTIEYMDLSIESCCEDFDPVFEYLYPDSLYCEGDTVWFELGHYDFEWGISIYFEVIDLEIVVPEGGFANIPNGVSLIDTTIIAYWIVGDMNDLPLIGEMQFCLAVGDSTEECYQEICHSLEFCFDGPEMNFGDSVFCYGDYLTVSTFNFDFIHSATITVDGQTQSFPAWEQWIIPPGAGQTNTTEIYIGSDFPTGNIEICMEVGYLDDGEENTDFLIELCQNIQVDSCCVNYPELEAYLYEDTMCNNAPNLMYINASLFYYEFMGYSGYESGLTYDYGENMYVFEMEPWSIPPNQTSYVYLEIFDNNDTLSMCRDSLWLPITSEPCYDCDTLGMIPQIDYQILGGNQLVVTDNSLSAYGYDIVDMNYNGQHFTGTPGSTFTFDMASMEVTDTLCIEISAFIEDICCMVRRCFPIVVNCETMGFEASFTAESDGFNWSINYTGNHTPDEVNWTFPDGSAMAGNIAQDSTSLLHYNWYDSLGMGGQLCLTAVIYIPSDCNHSMDCCIATHCVELSTEGYECQYYEDHLSFTYQEIGTNNYDIYFTPDDLLSDYNINIHQIYWTINHPINGTTDTLWNSNPSYAFACHDDLTIDYEITWHANYTVFMGGEGDHYMCDQSISEIFTQVPCNESGARPSIYPNPVNKELTIDFRGVDMQEANIQIFNTLGEKLLDKPVLEVVETISTAGWATGVYQVLISQPDRHFTEKVIKH